MTHLTAADIAAFRERRLGRATVEAVGAHVRECAACARLVFSDVGIQQSAQELWKPERRRITPLLVAAAAAIVVLAAAAAIVWSALRARPQSAPVPRRVPEQDIAPVARTIRDGSAAITLNADGSLRSVSTPRKEWDTLAADALEKGTVPFADRRDLLGSGEVLRGGEGDTTPPDPVAAIAASRKPRFVLRDVPGRTTSITLLEPVAVVVESDKPRFRWTPAAGARYRVLVGRDGTMVARSDLQSATTWTPAAPLPRGETYAWQLTVVRRERETTLPPPDAPQARFHVLSATDARELHDARATGSHLVTGLVAGRLGLNDLAARELNAFAAANPAFSAYARLARRYERPPTAVE